MGLSVGLGVPSQVPVGVVSAFAGVNAPAGWLMCAGQAVSRSDYSALFNALSTTYGSGDGSTTFNLPDLRGRVPAGVDNMGGSAASRLTSTVLSASNTLGASGGSQTHILTEAQMPVHTHVQNSHNHTQDAHGHTTGGSPGIYRNYLGGGSSHGFLSAITSTSVSDPYNTNSVTATNQATTATNQNTGSGSAHTNTQPTLVLNYIIKATQ